MSVSRWGQEPGEVVNVVSYFGVAGSACVFHVPSIESSLSLPKRRAPVSISSRSLYWPRAKNDDGSQFPSLVAPIGCRGSGRQLSWRLLRRKERASQ